MISKEQVKMQIKEERYELPTSTIDVVFLLLIFFMCSLNFRTIEQRLDAKLPLDTGNRPTTFTDETEISLRIYWANELGQVIHSPHRAFPEDFKGNTPALSTRGAHIVFKINQTKVHSIKKLAETLAALRATGSLPVVIDARRAVPFKYVVGSIDACAIARIEKVKFLSPPSGSAAGSDWFFM